MANDSLSIPQIETALTHSQFGIDPCSIYESLRSEAPVYWSDAFNAWIVSRYSDVADVLRDWLKLKEPPLTFTPSSAGARLASGPAH